MQPSYNCAVEVTRSARIAAPPARAWALIRDFDALPSWNASVRSSHIEQGPADRIGCRRALAFNDGGVWTHQLTGLFDDDTRLQGCIDGTPRPMRILVWDCRAEMQVQADPQQPENACVVTWRADFTTAEPHAMRERAAQAFEAGFAGLRARFGLPCLR